MTKYISVPLDTDPETIIQEVYDELQARIPNWTPQPASLETWLIEAFSNQGADLRDLASQVPEDIFRYFGARLMGIPPIAATSATVNSTWTSRDSLGHVIAVGTEVGIKNASGEVVPFQVANEIEIPAGSTSTGPGQILLTALSPGADTSGLGGNGIAAEPISPLEWIQTIVLTGVTSGGVDEEDNDVYLDRLRTQLQLVTPTPILARDFAILAHSIPGVGRALGIDNFVPPNLTNQERAVTVAVTDANGEPVSSGTKMAVQIYLESLRETNFVVYVIDPTYTDMAATVEVHLLPGYDAGDVEARVTEALLAYLNPKTWGIPNAGDEFDWLLSTAVRVYELAEIVNRVFGVDYIVSLTFGIAGGSQGTADVNLVGVAPLPKIISSNIAVVAT